MTYTVTNFKTKKELATAIQEGKQIRVFQPGPFGSDVPDGKCYLEGPHYPQPHRWYAAAMVEGGIITKLCK